MLDVPNWQTTVEEQESQARQGYQLRPSLLAVKQLSDHEYVIRQIGLLLIAQVCAPASQAEMEHSENVATQQTLATNEGYFFFPDL